MGTLAFMISEFEVAGEIMNVLQDHDKIRTWLISAADSAISLPSKAVAKEGALRLRSAIDRAVPIPYEPQKQGALQSLGDVCDTPRAREFARIGRFVAMGSSLSVGMMEAKKERSAFCLMLLIYLA